MHCVTPCRLCSSWRRTTPEAQEVSVTPASSYVDGFQPQSELRYVHEYPPSLLEELERNRLLQECAIDVPLNKDKLNVVFYDIGTANANDRSIPYPPDTIELKEQAQFIANTLLLPIQFGVSHNRVPLSVGVKQPSNTFELKEGEGAHLKNTFQNAFRLPVYPILMVDSDTRSGVRNNLVLLAKRYPDLLRVIFHELGHQLWGFNDEYTTFHGGELIRGSHPSLFTSPWDEGVQKTLETYHLQKPDVRTTLMMSEGRPVFQLGDFDIMGSAELWPVGRDNLNFIKHVMQGGQIFSDEKMQMLHQISDELIAKQKQAIREGNTCG